MNRKLSFVVHPTDDLSVITPQNTLLSTQSQYFIGLEIALQRANLRHWAEKSPEMFTATGNELQIIQSGIQGDQNKFPVSEFSATHSEKELKLKLFGALFPVVGLDLILDTIQGTDDINRALVAVESQGPITWRSVLHAFTDSIEVGGNGANGAINFVSAQRAGLIPNTTAEIFAPERSLFSTRIRGLLDDSALSENPVRIHALPGIEEARTGGHFNVKDWSPSKEKLQDITMMLNSPAVDIGKCLQADENKFLLTTVANSNEVVVPQLFRGISIGRQIIIPNSAMVATCLQNLEQVPLLCLNDNELNRAIRNAEGENATDTGETVRFPQVIEEGNKINSSAVREIESSITRLLQQLPLENLPTENGLQKIACIGCGSDGGIDVFVRNNCDIVIHCSGVVPEDKLKEFLERYQCNDLNHTTKDATGAGDAAVSAGLTLGCVPLNEYIQKVNRGNSLHLNEEQMQIVEVMMHGVEERSWGELVFRTHKRNISAIPAERLRYTRKLHMINCVHAVMENQSRIPERPTTILTANSSGIPSVTWMMKEAVEHELQRKQKK